jgi:hypothetical protein
MDEIASPLVAVRPLGSQPAAVRLTGKWAAGFVNRRGNE